LFSARKKSWLLKHIHTVPRSIRENISN
jgi:hypothetical protein